MAVVYPATASHPTDSLVGSIARKAFSFPVLLGVLLMAGAFKCSLFSVMDVDTWWHLAVGERILATGTWPTSDVYSFTAPGSHWIAYEWLSEVVMAAGARLGGLRGLTGLLLVLTSTFLLLLYYYAHLRSGNVKAAFVACVVVLPLLAPFFTLRAQLFGYAYLMVTLICLEHFRQGRAKALWILPGVFLLWVNTHGSFALGLLVLGLYWVSGLRGFRWGGLVGEAWTAGQRRQLGVVILLCVVVLPLTPYGTRLAAYPLQMALLQPVNIANMLEWQPLDFSYWWGKLVLVLLLLLFVAQVFFRPTYRLEELGLLLFAIFAACIHKRFVLFFVVVFTPLLASLVARWVSSYEAAKDRYLLNASLIALVAAGLAMFIPSKVGLERLVGRQCPRQAVEYLRQHPAAPLLNEFRWGGYLIWALGPEHKVFIDGRTDLYEYAGVLTDYLHVTRLEPDTLFLLRKYDVQACLLERKAPLATLLAALPDWERAYSDELSTLLVRKAGEHGADSGTQLGKAEISQAKR